MATLRFCEQHQGVHPRTRCKSIGCMGAVYGCTSGQGYGHFLVCLDHWLGRGR